MKPTYSTSFASARGKLIVRWFKNGKEYRSKTTSTLATTEELNNPSPLLDAVLADLTARIKKALYLSELDGTDPYTLMYPASSQESLMPDPFSYFTAASKRDFKLRNFCVYISRGLNWEDITDSFIDDYKEQLGSDDYADNSKRAYMTGLKMALDKARRDGAEFPAKDYAATLKGKIGTSVGVYLTKSEIDSLALVSTESDLEEAVKTLALVGIWTGARFSDYTRLKSANVVEVEYEGADGASEKVGHIQYVSEKTNTLTMVPLKPVVLELLAGCSGNKVTVQQMNSVLPKLCRRAGITSPVSVVHADKTIIGEKCDFVRSHTCRRSFAVGVYLSGEYDLRDIAKFLGHKSTETTMKYISCPSVRRGGVIKSWFN